MQRRRYLMVHTALELLDDDGDSILLNFRTKRSRTQVRSWIKRKCSLTYRDRDRSARTAFGKMLSELQEAWQRRELSNFDYLMKLNEMAGRSYNDLNQYPVLPWVLSDYASPTLNLADPAVFRDLSKPMGAQDPAQADLVRQTYELFDDPDIPRFHYGSHYSTMGFVLYYLLRLEPFTSHHKALQSGRFDHADRLFHSLGQTYHSCTHSSSDVKELIPELFCLPDVLLNRNGLSLGTRQDGQAVDDVRLPPWASDAVDFVAKHRAALECDHVSERLHQWVDLIFGAKQRGPAAAGALNVFFYLTYEGTVDLSGLSSAEGRRALQAQIENFGQTPPQLFTSPHPRRRPAPPPPPLGAWPICDPTPVRPVGALRVPSVPAALHSGGDDSFLLLDMERQLTLYRGPVGEGARASAIGDVAALPAFAPGVTIARAVCLAATDGQPSKAWLASGGHWDGSLCLSTAHGGGGLRLRLAVHSETVTCVALSRCARYVLSGSLDATALLWDFGRAGLAGLAAPGAEASPRPSHVLRGHGGDVLCVAVSSVLRVCAVASRDGHACLYLLRDGRRVRTFTSPDATPIDAVLLSDAGYVLLSSSAATALHLFALNGQRVWSARLDGGVSCLSLSPCHNALLLGLDTGDVLAWALFDRTPLITYEACPGPVVCLAVSEAHLLVATSTRHVLKYPPPPQAGLLTPGLVVARPPR